MAKVVPFNGLRYNTEMFSNLDSVTAPPYDIISPAEQDALYEKSEYNIVRVDFAKEQDGDNEENNKYTRAGAEFASWIEKGVLKREEKPAFYIYEQVFQYNATPISLKGIISAVKIEEFENKVVLPHEETLSKAKTDRFNLMSTTDANMSQIYSLFLDEDSSVEALINLYSKGEPDVSFVADGIKQNIWIITDEEKTAKITEKFAGKQLFIADGHHRYETALRFRNAKREENPDVVDAPYDYVMMMLTSMNDPGLLVFPTHRMIRNLPDFDEAVLVGYLTEDFTVSKVHLTEGDYSDIITNRISSVADDKCFALYTGKDYYYRFELKNKNAIDNYITDKSQAYKNLDVTLLHTLVLERFLGIDQNNMANQKNLSYTRDAKEAIEKVQSGEYQCSFLINATNVSDIKEISLANEKMPQKSTYFWPKLVTGIVINKF
ncbi:MAG: DUF1015 domain-containing protein [Ruminococcaceae bacterium]|nr:DUF1015 domain-containing protein [Oscillospiraceae bacterium]